MNVSTAEYAEPDLMASDLRTDAGAGRQLFFFCPDFTDATTRKRVRQFIDHGYRVTGLGFRRARYDKDYTPEWPHILLGQTEDGRYGQRLWALLGALPIIFANRHRLKSSSLFYARNIDQLLLALFARLLVRTPIAIVYEVLDIQPIMMRRSLAAMILRWVERRCLQRIDMLVVSSPAFHRNFYEAVQRYRGKWFLLENKLHPSIAAARGGQPIGARSEKAPKWIVGYFGLIRGQQTFELMARLAERLEDKVSFRFRGILTTVDAQHFNATLARRPNMSYGGAYLPHQDLSTLYGEVDFAWALDLEHADNNSRWLMPCRFYEAGFFGVPCLAVRDFEVGAVVEERRIGFTFDAPFEDQIVEFFERLTRSEYEQARNRLRAAPTAMFVAGEDVARLCAQLDRLSRPQIRLVH